MTATFERGYSEEVCNICDSREYRLVRYFAEWKLGREPVKDVSIIQCRRCGVRRRAPAIEDDYGQEYHAPYVEQGQSIHPHQLHHFADLMTCRLRKLNESGIRFLDVGCSTGRALLLAKTMGFTAVGLDYSKWASNYCASLGFETHHGSLIGSWSEGECFDVIHCSHTIEHVTDPLAYLSEMNRLLTPGGHLMLAFPNYRSVPRILLGDRWPVWCLDSHLWQFTVKQMRSILQSKKFRIESCRTLHGYSPDSSTKKRLLDFGAALGFGDGCNIIAAKLSSAGINA
jgi:2-polyprenyl-3-methyl-5-hydroxy-6-metoxy-1,4-benzoquinol methylase